MRRPLIISAIAGAILLAVASPAAAAPGDYYADGIPTSSRGTGSVTVSLDADVSGDLAANVVATGGTKNRLLFGPYSSESRAYGAAYLTTQFPLSEEGRYEVTVTFHNAVTDESETGNGQAQGQVYASAYFPNEYTSTILGSETADLTSEPGTVVVQFEAEIAADAFAVRIELQALATATGAGNAASTEASAEDITISFIRVG